LNGADDQRPPTWVFARDTTTIRVLRLPEGRLQIESSEGQTREFSFPDLDELTAFHLGFEQHLVATGWSLVEFSPERRSGRDRRAQSRGGRDRRRPPLKPAARE
jgi:hypothetical protein